MCAGQIWEHSQSNSYGKVHRKYRNNNRSGRLVEVNSLTFFNVVLINFV